MRDKMSLHLPIIIFGKQCVSLLTLLQFANEDHWLLLLNETWFGLFAHGKSKTPKKCCCFISVLLFFSGNKWKGGSERKTWSLAQPQFVEGLHKPGSSAVRLPLRTISSWASRARPYSPAAVTEWGSPWEKGSPRARRFLAAEAILEGTNAWELSAESSHAEATSPLKGRSGVPVTAPVWGIQDVRTRMWQSRGV